MTVVDQIRDRYEDLSPTEQRIAQHYMQHGSVMAFASASQVARRLGVATSSVVRFAQELGYAGYLELQESMQAEYDAARKLLSVSVEREELLEHVVRLDGSNVASVLRNQAALLGASTALANAPQVWVVGSRSSGDIASIGQRVLNMVRPNVRMLNPSSAEVPDQLLDMGPDDILLIVIMSRYTQEVVRLVELAPHHAGNVLITDEHASPLLPIANWVISVSTQPAAIIRSPTAVLTALQTLIAATAREIGDDKVKERTAKAEELWARFQTFASR